MAGRVRARSRGAGFRREPDDEEEPPSSRPWARHEPPAPAAEAEEDTRSDTWLTAKMSSTPSKSSRATDAPPPQQLPPPLLALPKSLTVNRVVVEEVLKAAAVTGVLVGSELRDLLEDFPVPLPREPDSVWSHEQLSSSAIVRILGTATEVGIHLFRVFNGLLMATGHQSSAKAPGLTCMTSARRGTMKCSSAPADMYGSFIELYSLIRPWTAAYLRKTAATTFEADDRAQTESVG